MRITMSPEGKNSQIGPDLLYKELTYETVGALFEVYKNLAYL